MQDWVLRKALLFSHSGWGGGETGGGVQVSFAHGPVPNRPNRLPAVDLPVRDLGVGDPWSS